MQNWLNRSWKGLIGRGVVGILFGILIMFMPGETAFALGMLWGFFALFDGIGAFVQAFDSGESGGDRVVLIIWGIISLLAAGVGIFHPGLTAVTLTWMLGIWLFVAAIFQFFGAFSSTVDTPRWLLIVSAIISGILGFLFVRDPGSGAVSVAMTMGILLFAWGIVFVVLGFQVRGKVKDIEAPATS